MSTTSFSLILPHIMILPLIALISIKNIASNNIPNHRSSVSNHLPIYYYGFLNNAFYNLHKITSSGKIKMECPEGLVVDVTSATYGDLPINVTSSVACNKKMCIIDAKDYVKSPYKYLTVEYECVIMESFRPLFDGNKFHPGIIRDYLILEKEYEGDVPDYSITNSVKFVNYRKYPYIVWNGKEWIGRHGNWHGEKATALVNYDQFILSGYSVFVNYVAICNNVIGCYETDDVYGAYSECERTDCSFFTISFEDQLSIKTRRTWLCKGWPTIVPLKGHLAAVKTSAFEFNNLNTNIANRNSF